MHPFCLLEFGGKHTLMHAHPLIGQIVNPFETLLYIVCIKDCISANLFKSLCTQPPDICISPDKYTKFPIESMNTSYTMRSVIIQIIFITILFYSWHRYERREFLHNPYRP